LRRNATKPNKPRYLLLGFAALNTNLLVRAARREAYRKD
jgi:hypothetical protein